MKKLILLSGCLACLFVLAGCANGRALFLFEQPYWSTLGRDTLTRAELAFDGVARGYLPRIVVIPIQERPLDRLLREAARLGRGVVVVGPLLSYEWPGFVDRLPAERFILVGSIPAANLPPNALVLSFDRTAAFRSAGRSAARAAAAAGGSVGMLVSADGDMNDAEIAAFAGGAAEESGTVEPVPRTLAAGPDRSAIQSTIEQMRRAGTAVFLLGLGSMDPWALEVMKADGGSAVLAGWRVSGAFPEQVLLSVEENVPAGIALALAAERRGLKEVTGPVTLASGAAGSAKTAPGAR